MTDLEKAVQNLGAHSICLCRGDEIIFDDGKGISPMMKLIASGKDISGFSAADVIVGKAAAMLFVKAGLSAVHGSVMSEAALAFLSKNGIPCTYGELTDKIINRKGDDICPMEKTVAGIDDPEEAYTALRERLAEMRSGKTQ